MKLPFHNNDPLHRAPRLLAEDEHGGQMSSSIARNPRAAYAPLRAPSSKLQGITRTAPIAVTSGLSLCVACGPVHLGYERTDAADPGTPKDFDAGAAVMVVATISAQGACEGCFDVHVDGTGGRPPYRFEWEDGSDEANRRICLDANEGVVTVTALDADGVRSAPYIATLIAPADAGCPSPSAATLCLANPSFEGRPAANLGGQDAFDCAPWSACTNPAQSNTPDVVNDSIEQMIAVVPAPTDGLTFLGMTEGEQVSQRLCEPLLGGSEVSFRVDLSRLYIGAGVVPDTELPYLEIWGGVASGCSAQEMLWASEPLPLAFQTYCVTLRPRHFTDSLFLRARTDNSLPSVAYLLVDNIVPVSACP